MLRSAPTLTGMDDRAEIRAFLKSRRDKITPERAGVPVYGDRRVPGLRRSEVALLAGVSVEYYTRLERGSLGGVSDSVLDSLAEALRLDDTERVHLYDLARAANARPGRARQRRLAPPSVPPGVQRMVDAIPTLPVCVTNNRFGHQPARTHASRRGIVANTRDGLAAARAHRRSCTKVCVRGPTWTLST
jgi:transcriptional regulator with XRE-family HTH domain